MTAPGELVQPTAQMDVRRVRRKMTGRFVLRTPAWAACDAGPLANLEDRKVIKKTEHFRGEERICLGGKESKVMQHWKVTRSMQNRLLICAILAASWVAVVPAFAAAPTPTPTPTATATATTTPIPNDKAKFLGDRIVFKQNIIANLQDFELTKEATPKPDYSKLTETLVCIPGGTYLRGIGQKSSVDQLFVVDCNWHQFFASLPWGFCGDKDVYECGYKEDKAGSPCTRENHCIPAGSQIKLTLDQLGPNATPPDRYGFTYGALVVPFKFELTGQKEFKGSASLAPYMGYRLGFESSGIELAFPVVFAGISNVSATKTTTTTTAATATTPASSTDSTSTSDLAAFSYGAGVIGILKQTFQFGAVVGFDHVGSGQGYQYNDKPWLAVEVGYQFSQ